MKRPFFSFLLLTFVLGIAVAGDAAAQTGTISGRVTEQRTGQGLPGVNVSIPELTTGAVTDVDGYYYIINVRPGTYTVRASFIGFTPQTAEGVRVNIDQTTTLNFQISEEAIGVDEVVVVAQRPVVEADVATSRANVSAAQIEQLPVASVTAAIGQQAGIEGLSIRGSSSDEVSFNVNGLTLRDERSNAPYTGIPLASVQEVQVVTSGFNAEYGNVRSGVVNVITKEGRRDRYEVDAIIRYSPPTPKNFGEAPNDPNSYWIRPFVDPDVAWTGTKNGAWDIHTQRQYPEFRGWVAVSEELLKDNDPSNDMTPEALQRAFLWQHRKQMKVTEPDYNLDMGIGGPVPGLNRFGDMRFYASYKRDQSMYFIPLATDRYLQQTGHFKVTSDFRRGMRLTLETLYGNVTGTASSRSGSPGVFSSASGIASQLSPATGGGVGFIDSRIFSDSYWNPTETRDFMLGAKFTQTLDASTFYEVRFTRYASFYDTNPGRLRDTTGVVSFGGVRFDEAPFGFLPVPENPFSQTGVGSGMRMAVGMSNARDTSRVTAYNLKGDLTRQMNRFFQLKTGFEFNLTNSRVNYGSFDAVLPSSNFNVNWDRNPSRAATYVQGKLEFRGMIANPGLRLDYSHAGGEWYSYDTFDPSVSNISRLDTAATEPTKRIFTLSPRLGVSFPVTEFSKLFFNYGHFRSMPSPDDLYRVQFTSQNGNVTAIANPNNPLPKTVQYELGYEQSLFNQFLIRVAGYYKNVSLEQLSVSYTPLSGVSYSRREPNAYADIRGFEFTFSRDRGRWFQGFVNYTYMVRTSGRFGLEGYFQNPSAQRAQEQSDAVRARSQSRPVPQPYARMNLVFFSPRTFGPEAGGLYPLGDLRLSLLGSWRAGSYMTYVDGGFSREGILNNLQRLDFTNLDLRVTKDVSLRGRRFQLFMDVNNVLNQKRLSEAGFVDGDDRLRYYTSLHLPVARQNEYSNIPGNDRPGVFRKAGVAYQPMQSIADRNEFNNPDPKVIYYDRGAGAYFEFRDGAWVAPDAARLQQVLNDKAYIDMPNQGFLTFLNPRNVYFGFRINL